MDIYQAIEQTLQPALKQVLTEIGYSGAEVIFSHQNGLEPANTYCIINFLEVDQVGYKNESTLMLGDNRYVETMTHYCLKTQLTFVGENAGNVAMGFRHNLINNRKCFEILQKANYGILKRGNLRRIPQKRETGWVECLNTDIDFSFAVLTRQSYDWVEYIVINEETIHLPV